jgi:putative membrane protein
MRLVVCVDRDDDLGRKAGVEGPIVGRTAVVAAATKLAVADPEDADTNAMFAAVRLHDELHESGEETEVVVLTGSPKVGVVSDRRVGDQFDRVLREHPASGAHLVSDGAEDEYLFPILASRVRIDSVHRVFIRQSASLESTYYTMVRALKDPKLRAKTVLPFALILLGLGLAAASHLFLWGLIGLSILLGVYLVFWTFDIDEAIIDSLRSASTDIRTGSVAFGFGLFATALVGLGFLEGYNLYLHGATPIAAVLYFLTAALVWWVFGGQVWEAGRALRRYLTIGRVPRSFPIAAISIAALGFISYGIVFLTLQLESVVLPNPPSLPTSAFVWILVIGFGLLVAAGALNQYLKLRPAPSPSEILSGQAEP